LFADFPNTVLSLRIHQEDDAPLTPGFNFDRYDGELRRPLPFEPQSAPESEVSRREHGITDPAKLAASLHNKATSATGHPKWLESQ
jgi:hypothetical protein